MTAAPRLSRAVEVLIFGSCVSRDAMEFQDRSSFEFRVVDYYARSSLASLGCPAPAAPLNVYTDCIASAFQKRMVLRDIEKTYLDSLGTLEFDIMLLDLIDERFDVWVDLEGGAVTLSSELVQTGFAREAGRSGRTVASGSDEFFRLWERGWVKLFNRLAELEIVHTLRINKVMWSKRTAGGHAFPKVYSEPRIDAANALLVRMYARIQQDVPAWQFLSFGESELLAADSHRWGLSPFHYVHEYYRALIRQLETYNALAMVPMTDLDEALDPKPEFHDPFALRRPVFAHPSISSAVATGLAQDGIHRIALSSRQALDVCTERMSRLGDGDQVPPGGRWLLVGLAGAVTAVPGRVGPFFSGLGIARELGFPIISISDPTLALSSSLGLAWYAGNADVPDLPDRLASLLNGLSEAYSARLLVFGGSGGGFASLAIAARLRCEATVYVWNSQTTLANYVPSAVRDYVLAGFPALRSQLAPLDDVADGDKPALLRRVLDEAGVHHEVCGQAWDERVELLYLQNQADWHLTKHAQPFLEAHSYQAAGNAAFTSPTARQSVYFGKWGKGHDAPERAMTLFVLKQIADGVQPQGVARALDLGVAGVCEPSTAFFWLAAAETGSFYVTAARRGNDILVDAWFERDVAKFGDTVQFAFYLLVNNERKQVKWYGSSPQAVFEWPESTSGGVAVVAFVRDQLGRVVSAATDVVSEMPANFEASLDLGLSQSGNQVVF